MKKVVVMKGIKMSQRKSCWQKLHIKGTLGENGTKVDEGDFPNLWNSRLETVQMEFLSLTQKSSPENKTGPVQKQWYLPKNGPYWNIDTVY